MLLTRCESSNGVVYYRSPLLHSAGVPHAFSTRIGGVSPPPFDSLNLGNPSGCDIRDDLAHVAENYRRLLSAIGCDDCGLCSVHQVHGNNVVVVQPGEPFDPNVKADALVTNDSPRMVSVRVADCVPILLSSRDGRCVAAVHAGWRGVIANVVAAAIDRMRRLGHDDFVAAIGPCISADAYEVGPEVVEQFEKTFPDAPLRRRDNGRSLIDLPAAAHRQLLNVELTPDDIDTSDCCTFGDHDEFFSHRRENGRTGRMAAVIGCGVT